MSPFSVYRTRPFRYLTVVRLLTDKGTWPTEFSKWRHITRKYALKPGVDNRYISVWLWDFSTVYRSGHSAADLVVIQRSNRSIEVQNKAYGRDVDTGGWEVLTPWKCVGGLEYVGPHKMSHFFIQNCCSITLQLSHHQGWKTCVRYGR